MRFRAAGCFEIKPQNLANGFRQAKCELPLPPAVNQSAGDVYQLLDDRSDTTTFHVFRSTGAGQLDPSSLRLFKALLTDDAQCVVSENRQMQRQNLSGKMAYRQPFDVHVGFQFAVILLAGVIIMLQINHFPLGHIQQVAPVSFRFNFWKHKFLTFFIDAVLDHLENDWMQQRLSVHHDGSLADINTLSLGNRSGIAAAAG